MTARALPDELLHAARAPYRRVGRFAYGFARGKLAGDPAYRAILEHGLLRGQRQVLDLGCGLGLLAALLRAAERCSREGFWPEGWATPPQDLAIRGIELRARTVERARRALGQAAEIIQGDIRVADFGSADAVIILDVLHYIDAGAHRSLLQRVRSTLPPDGLLLLRVGDAAGGLRFRIGQWWDEAVMLARGHGWIRQHCRSLLDWRALLLECGFDSQVLSMSAGTPFANVLLCARPR
ncbi:MAG TPA: class I SAM-dependent methyltransferase [Steroidobacteraceae bacterium]